MFIVYSRIVSKGCFLFWSSWYLDPESAKVCALRSLAPAHFTCPSLIRTLRALLAINTSLRAFTLPNKRFVRLFFILYCVVSIVRYDGLRLKNTRKATWPDFIPLKFIKFASNAVDSHLYNIITKDLEKEQVLKRAKNSISKTHFQEKWKKQDRKL